jgi:hypothetical protein
MRHPDKFPEEVKLWNRFKGCAFAKIFGDYRREMEAYMKKKGIHEKFQMMIYSTYHRAWDSFYGYDDYEKAPPYVKTMEDPKALAEVFDYISPMIYPDVYAKNRDYDMTVPWKDTYSLREIVGTKALITPLLSPGFAFIDPYNSDNSPEMIGYNILETIAGGAKGFGFWGACPLDAADMKVIAETINMLAPVEEVILNGYPFIGSSVSGNVFVKGVKSQNKALVLVSEYSRRPLEAQIISPFAGEHVKIIDLATGKQVASTFSSVQHFTVKMEDNRAKIYLITRQ